MVQCISVLGEGVKSLKKAPNPDDVLPVLREKQSMVRDTGSL